MNTRDIRHTTVGMVLVKHGFFTEKTPIAERIEVIDELIAAVQTVPEPLRIICEGCGRLHVDDGEFATKPHHTHACQNCGLTWRPGLIPTVGVRFLPGFKGEAKR